VRVRLGERAGHLVDTSLCGVLGAHVVFDETNRKNVYSGSTYRAKV
jgi:hypothetical protein